MSKANDQYYEWYYEGPVLEFGKVIATSWSSSTQAPTRRKALSNLMYQFKKQYNMIPSAKITLEGELYNLG